MKITKSELSQIIKEEAQRFITIQKLKAEKAEIEKMINESYMEEMDYMEGEEYMEEGLGDAVGKFLGGVQKMGTKIVTNKEERAKAKEQFDKRMSDFKSWLEKAKAQGWSDEDVRVATATEELKGWNSENEAKFIKNAENHGYLGNIVFKAVPNRDMIALNFAPGSLTGAGGQGGTSFKKDPNQKNENISESEIRKIVREESFKTEKLKQIQERAEKISKELKNL